VKVALRMQERKKAEEDLRAGWKKKLSEEFFTR